MTEEWESPADVEFEDPNDNLLVNLDVSNAEIYPTNMNINANNIQIEYDSNSGEYFAKHTYSHPVTKAEFTFDMQNSTLPQNIPIATRIKYWVNNDWNNIPLRMFNFNDSGSTIQINLENTINNYNCLIAIYIYTEYYQIKRYFNSGSTPTTVSIGNGWYYWTFKTSYSNIKFMNSTGNELFEFGSETNREDKIYPYKRLITLDFGN